MAWRARVGAVLVLTGWLGASAWAQWFPRVSAQGGELRVNDLLVMRIRRSLAGLAPPQRAVLAAERLRELTRAGMTPEQVRVDIEAETRWRWSTRTVYKNVTRTVTRRVGKRKKRRRRVQIEVRVPVRERYKDFYQVETEARLMGREKVIASAGSAEARAAGQEKPSALAESWAAALKKALQIPGLAVSDEGVVVPWQETRRVRLSGAARGPVQVLRPDSAGSPVGVSVDEKAGIVTLTGAMIGREVVSLSREGATASIQVAVQPYAAQILPPRPVTLTGRGVDSERIGRLILTHLRGAIVPREGALLRIEEAPVGVRPPAVGKSVAVSVPVSVSGPEMIPVRRTLRVPVVGTSLPRAETGALFFSNNPERLTMPQTLYVGRLSMGTARLLYHHQNAADSACWFSAELINDGDTPAQVQVVGGDAGPERDTVWVGYRVASEFLTRYTADSGMVVEVPARSRIALQATRLPPGQTLSGLMQLRLVAGPPPLVRVAAERPGEPGTVGEILRPFPLTAETDALVSDARRLSAHVYPQPSKKLSARYSVGGRWAFLSVGRAPIAGTTEGQVLEGNYGVFYDIVVALENPTERRVNVQVLFEPAGGMAGAVFVVDGKRVEIPRTSPPTETTLATIALKPGEKRTLTMRTVPLSGSNYPINLIVRS